MKYAFYLKFVVLLFFIAAITSCHGRHDTESPLDSTEKQKKNESLNSKITIPTKLNDCACKDSFYCAILDKPTIESLRNKKRFHLDFYENKSECLDSFKIEAWYQGSNLNIDPVALPIQESNAAMTVFTTPYHFRDIQVAIWNQGFQNIISLVNGSGHRNCNYYIALTPFQNADGVININAQIFYDCSHNAFPTWTAGSSIDLNPCPPKKPQG